MMNSTLMYQVSNIHSKQPWIVLSSDNYSTCLATENPIVSHFYAFNAGTQAPIAVPDGCVDLVFDCDVDKPNGRVYGTPLEAKQLDFQVNHRYFGIRFIPGVMPNFLDVSAKDLIDGQFNIADVINGGQTLFEQVTSATSFSEQVTAANKFIKGKQARTPSNLTNQIITKICKEKGNIQIKDLENYTGYCARTLQRQFLADIGLSPKAFCRAIRCQSAIYDINHKDNLVFSDLAFDLGFSDQSHFLREFKKLVSTTPLDYQNKVKQKTYLEKIRCY